MVTKSDFILQYLADKPVKGAYVYELFKEWSEEAYRRGKPPGKYDDIRRVVSKLRKEGVIEVAGTEEIPNKWARTYYRLVS